MKPENRKFHLNCLSAHNHSLYESLIYPHHIISDSMKSVSFNKDGNALAPLKGYFAVKDKIKYFIDAEVFDKLPIRLGDNMEELTDKDDVVLRPLNPIPMKILPLHSFDFRAMVDSFAPFSHSHPDQWTLAKLIALSSYIGKTFICVSSISSFGKTSLFDLLHGITDKCPVFKPRSVPGVLVQINGTGNLVFDEVHECKKEVKECMEEFSLQIGGNKSSYINGALQSKHTKSKYPCPNQSITYLFNDVENYKEPEKNYFEVIFTNNKAMDSRFLKLRLKGELTEKFDCKFDISAEAESNRDYYIKLAKELTYLQECKKNNQYRRRYQLNSILALTGRRKQVYDEIVWSIDMFSQDQDEFNKYINLLDIAIIDYKEMVSRLKGETENIAQEEVI